MKLSSTFKITYVNPTDKSGDKIEFVGPYDESDFASPERHAEYVDLSRIGRGEDTYNQTSTLERSNFRSLIRDYPDTFTVRTWSNVEGLGALVSDLDDDMIELLNGLADEYAVYDEGDMSELESDEITESIEQYALFDFGRALASETWNDLSDTLKSELFHWALHATDYYPEHDGHDVLWRYEDMAARLRNVLAAMAVTPEPARKPLADVLAPIRAASDAMAKILEGRGDAAWSQVQGLSIAEINEGNA